MLDLWARNDKRINILRSFNSTNKSCLEYVMSCCSVFNSLGKVHIVSLKLFDRVNHTRTVIDYRRRKCGKRLGKIICVCCDSA